MIFHPEPRLTRRVSQASGSSSTAASCRNPACSRPSDWPPAPAQISRQVSSPTVPPALASCLIVPAGTDSRCVPRRSPLPGSQCVGQKLVAEQTALADDLLPGVPLLCVGVLAHAGIEGVEGHVVH